MSVFSCKREINGHKGLMFPCGKNLLAPSVDRACALYFATVPIFHIYAVTLSPSIPLSVNLSPLTRHFLTCFVEMPWTPSWIKSFRGDFQSGDVGDEQGGLACCSPWDHKESDNSATELTDARLALAVKNPPANAGDVRDTGSIPGSGRSPRGGQPTPVFVPGKSHLQRSLEGYSP